MSSLFVLDTAGDQKLNELTSSKRSSLVNSKKRRTLEGICRKKSLKADECANSDNDDDYLGLPPLNVDLSEIIDSAFSKKAIGENKNNRALEEISVSIDAALQSQTQGLIRTHHKRIIDLDHSDFNVETGKFDDEQLLKVEVNELLSNSRQKPGLEDLKAQPILSEQKKARLNRLERAKTKGGDWYNLPATEVTDEVQNELKILQMRSVLDPKHFYKKNDLKVLPKYFQIGTVLPSPLDHYKERDTRKNKKRSLVDELLADTEFQSFNKRKYNEVMARKNKYAQRKSMKKMKKLKKHK